MYRPLTAMDAPGTIKVPYFECEISLCELRIRPNDGVGHTYNLIYAGTQEVILPAATDSPSTERFFLSRHLFNLEYFFKIKSVPGLDVKLTEYYGIALVVTNTGSTPRAIVNGENLCELVSDTRHHIVMEQCSPNEHFNRFQDAWVELDRLMRRDSLALEKNNGTERATDAPAPKPGLCERRFRSAQGREWTREMLTDWVENFENRKDFDLIIDSVRENAFTPELALAMAKSVPAKFVTIIPDNMFTLDVITALIENDPEGYVHIPEEFYTFEIFAHAYRCAQKFIDINLDDFADNMIFIIFDLNYVSRNIDGFFLPLCLEFPAVFIPRVLRVMKHSEPTRVMSVINTLLRVDPALVTYMGDEIAKLRFKLTVSL
jgi:hypothetical protein